MSRTSSRSAGLALACAIFAAGSLAVPAFAADPAKVADTAKGKTLVNAAGMTLYVFAKDKDGASTCNGPCAINWPPLKAEAGAKAAAPWSVITRADGSSQWAYKGKPLYTWSKDKAPGDVSGDGFLDGAWSVAHP
ncbi:hypothetical protein V5F59_08820 [Xanthobacter autotrophicus DSM 431]|uniref:COG4315 family predicted lipoprotein n=1 Tax=Xanthobacter nonsaccharivorans TaxID=3119912 RepID=UPI00372A3B6B